MRCRPDGVSSTQRLSDEDLNGRAAYARFYGVSQGYTTASHVHTTTFSAACELKQRRIYCLDRFDAVV